MAYGFLEDTNGNKSSKRLGAFIGLGCAMVAAILGAVFRCEVAGVVYAFLTFAGGCLGIGVLERK